MITWHSIPITVSPFSIFFHQTIIFHHFMISTPISWYIGMHPTLAGFYPFFLGSPARCAFLSYLWLYICLGSPAISWLSHSAVALTRSPLGRQAKNLNYKALIGSFHRHAHNHLCQLRFLATYVKGMGLEDLEGGECFFFKLNALASSICHAGIFNHKQKIVEFTKHMDQNKTYQNLSMYPPFLLVARRHWLW